MKRAALMLKRNSQKIVPVKTSNLKGGAFADQVEGTSGFLIVMEVGYVADYAVYVHEDLDAHHKPGKTAKYLEIPLRALDLEKFVRDAVLQKAEAVGDDSTAELMKEETEE